MASAQPLHHLRDLYLAELQELRSAEELMSGALPELSGRAENDDLSRLLADDIGETRSHRDRLDEILERHGAHPGESRDRSMATLVDEARRWSGMIEDPECRDAALIAAAQRLQHYEIAVYGSLATWAKQLELNEDLPVLLDILEEEKRTDEKLSNLAKSMVNPAAM